MFRQIYLQNLLVIVESQSPHRSQDIFPVDGLALLVQAFIGGFGGLNGDQRPNLMSGVRQSSASRKGEHITDSQ